jgi:hypothetical protein
MGAVAELLLPPAVTRQPAPSADESPDRFTSLDPLCAFIPQVCVHFSELSGGADNDTLTGGLGQDSIYGGDGFDQLIENVAGNVYLNHVVDYLYPFGVMIYDSFGMEVYEP